MTCWNSLRPQAICELSIEVLWSLTVIFARLPSIARAADELQAPDQYGRVPGFGC